MKKILQFTLIVATLFFFLGYDYSQDYTSNNHIAQLDDLFPYFENADLALTETDLNASDLILRGITPASYTLGDSVQNKLLIYIFDSNESYETGLEAFNNQSDAFSERLDQKNALIPFKTQNILMILSVPHNPETIKLIEKFDELCFYEFASIDRSIFSGQHNGWEVTLKIDYAITYDEPLIKTAYPQTNNFTTLTIKNNSLPKYQNTLLNCGFKKTNTTDSLKTYTGLIEKETLIFETATPILYQQYTDDSYVVFIETNGQSDYIELNRVQ